MFFWPIHGPGQDTKMRPSGPSPSTAGERKQAKSLECFLRCSVRGAGGRGCSAQRLGQARGRQCKGHTCGPTPHSCPSLSPDEALGDAHLPIWTLAQASVAMTTGALWWEQEGSSCVEISIGGSSSALWLRWSKHF